MRVGPLAEEAPWEYGVFSPVASAGSRESGSGEGTAEPVTRASEIATRRNRRTTRRRDTFVRPDPTVPSALWEREGGSRRDSSSSSFACTNRQRPITVNKFSSTVYIRAGGVAGAAVRAPLPEARGEHGVTWRTVGNAVMRRQGISHPLCALVLAPAVSHFISLVSTSRTSLFRSGVYTGAPYVYTRYLPRYYYTYGFYNPLISVLRIPHVHATRALCDFLERSRGGSLLCVLLSPLFPHALRLATSVFIHLRCDIVCDIRKPGCEMSLPGEHPNGAIRKINLTWVKGSPCTRGALIWTASDCATGPLSNVSLMVLHRFFFIHGAGPPPPPGGLLVRRRG